MDLIRTNRWKLSCRNIFLFGLALLVFAWGLQYKLSLDLGPHSTLHKMVEAKLLSGDDLGAAAKSPTASLPSDLDNLPPVAPLSVLLLSLVAISLWGASAPPIRREPVTARLWRKPDRATHGAFFFRPPPSL